MVELNQFVALRKAEIVQKKQYGEENGRSGGIRTHDPLTPSQVRYRAALRSEPGKALECKGIFRKP